jgi:hypothetical protein
VIGHATVQVHTRVTTQEQIMTVTGVITAIVAGLIIRS